MINTQPVPPVEVTESQRLVIETAAGIAQALMKGIAAPDLEHAIPHADAVAAYSVYTAAKIIAHATGRARD